MVTYGMLVADEWSAEGVWQAPCWARGHSAPAPWPASSWRLF